MTTEQEYKFNDSASDDQLNVTIDAWVEESEPYHTQLLRSQKKSVEYYLGDQTDLQHVPSHQPNTVFNRIFEATETLVPIITGSAHQFIALPGNENEMSLKRAKELQSVLTKKYEDLYVTELLEQVARDIILKRFGVLEWYWDTEIDDVGLRWIDARTVLVPKLRVNPNDLPYVIKILDFTKGELEEQFPKAKTDAIGSEKKLDTNKPNTETRETYQVLEVRTDEYWVWKCGDTILKKTANPYWDFDGEKSEDEELKFFNHLEKPNKALVFFAPFRTGDAPFSETSLAEVAIPIQDDINVQKRQILLNLKQMGNGQVYIDRGALEEEMIEQISNETGLQIVGDGVASENRVRREPGVPLPSAHFNNLVDSMQEFDAVFGVQPSVRGSSESKTLGGQMLNRQQSLTRIDLLTRELNRGIARCADGLTQLMKMFYTEQRTFRILGRSETLEFIEFTRDKIDDDTVVETRAGETFPEDPVQKANRAIQLFQLGALDPVTLYEMTGVPNPEETAAKLQAWLQGQLVQEAQKDIATAQAGAQARQGAQEQRGVETSNSSTTRAAQEATGTTPAKLPNVPKM